MLNQQDEEEDDEDAMEVEDDAAVPEQRHTLKLMVDTWMLRLLTNEETGPSNFIDKTGIRR